LAYWFGLLFVLLTATGVSGTGLTNRVNVIDDIFFEITDGHGPTNSLDLKIEATNSLYYLVHRGTNRGLRAALRQDEMPVVLELRDPNGKPVPKTPMGTTNALVPPSEATIRFGTRVVVESGGLFRSAKPTYVRGEPIWSGSYLLREVGLITDFFKAKEPGTYTLEARLRYWCPTNKTWRWFLTDPVCLPVIVRNPRPQNGPELNNTLPPLQSLVFSNGIRAVDDIYFAITTPEGPSSFSPNREIEATSFLSWSIHNRGSERRRLSIRLGDVPVVLTLSDAQGIPVPRTPMGASTAIAPPSDAGLATNRFQSISGLTGSHLGYLSNFFEINEHGTYALEGRWRYWYPANGAFVWSLSEPVRLPVIVRGPLTPATAKANSDPQFRWAPQQQRSLLPGEWTPPNLPVFGRDFATNAVPRPFVDIAKLVRDHRSNDVDIRIESHTRSNTLLATLYARQPVPAAMAVTVDAPEWPPESAWIPFQTNYLVTLPPAEARYKVKFSFRFADDQMYAEIRPVQLDTTPPVVVFTNPASATIAQCMVQLQGYSLEPINQLLCSVRSGFRQSELRHCGGPAVHRDEVQRFTCTDLDLSPGPNQIFFTCQDDAGNPFTTNFTLIVSMDNKPPRLTLTSPMPNAAIKGEHLSISGETPDAATTIRARVLTNPRSDYVYDAEMYRGGRFVISSLPLKPGTNLIQLLATDCAGFNTITNLSVTRTE
jgi:hypothetical protein